MGLLDKVKDFLDDGKINGSVGNSDSNSRKAADPEAQQPYSNGANYLPAETALIRKLATSHPYEYKDYKDRLFDVTINGSCEVVVRKPNMTDEELDEILGSFVDNTMNSFLTQMAHDKVAADIFRTQIKSISMGIAAQSTEDLEITSCSVAAINVKAK